ncbi:zinc finger protein 354B-like protein [Lates japonicus]|uniref:Zinc finger protein 354B-like protein n=1 Tax=Lates japonicus TaxID=270547 RepID=A0AAD3MMY2_LATJO|nr:zinc finger protein 354B-like protein [Lates japonicus]
MEDNSKGNCSCLPLSALRLLVSPIQLVSAAVWQTIQHKVVADYGMLEEFVSMVTDIVPELLTIRQRAQLTLGLRARLILELCQFEASADSEIVRPHLDRMQSLTEAWAMEAGATNVEAPNSNFVDLVKNMLKNPDQRENFFQKVFPEEFGPTFDEALHTLMWLLLSRLEKFLPLQTFQQVASMFDEVSSVLVDCLESVSRCEELRTVLQYRKDLSRLDHNDGSLDNTCIISALKLPTTKRKRLDMPLSAQSRPVRRNRGLKMKKILLREKRGVREEALSACKPASSKTKPSSRAPPDVSDNEDSSSSYMAPVSHCSDDDSWSFYSDEDSRHNTASGSASMTDSWSHYSDDASSLVTPVSSPTGYDSSSGLSDEGLPLVGPKILPASSRKPGVSDIKGSTPQKKGQVYCFICKEHVNTGLKTHMKTHFPAGDYACPRCDSRFKLFTSFKMHVRRTCYEYSKQQVDPEKPGEAKNLYKCDKCQEAFRYKVSLDRHKLTHNELYCSVCRKVLRDTATLARHKASHTLFQCTRCEETFTLFMPLLRHCENIHNISRPFKCNHCPKTLPKLRFLILHEWTHTGHLPFQCAQCGCRFKSDADLIYHQRVHTKEKPYLCAECGKTFSQNSNLLRHLNLIHGEFRDEKRHACSQCEKSFKEKGALKKHQRTKHLNELFRHPCPYCGKIVSATTLARHKLIHTGERPFKCTVPECDKRFRSTSEVKKHVLIQHTTERPYKCDVCGKGFIKMCFLNAHAKIHSGEKPFVCHICGKAFPKLYSMQRHKKLVH